MKGQNFRQLYESLGPRGTYEKITECLREGRENPTSPAALQPQDIDLRECFIGMCGESAYVRLGERYARSGRRGESGYEVTRFDGTKDDSFSSNANYKRLEESLNWSDDPVKVLREAGEAVDVSAFSAITGQIAYNYIGKGWNNAEMVGDRIFENFPTEFSGQKVPWLSNIFGATPGDSDIHPLMNYPETTIGPRYITTPRVFKKGGILSFSLEFMLFDRTGQAQSSATLENLGKAIRYDKEYMQLRVFMGYNPTGPLSVNATGQYSYNLNGVAYAPYLTSGSNYVNSQGTTPLVDYTSVNNSIYLRSKILDPDTGRPIAYGAPMDMFVMPFQMMNAKRIKTATGYQTIFPGYSASSPAAPGNVKLDSGNPIDWNINLMTSPIAYQILLQATISPTGSSGSLSSTQVNAYWWNGVFRDALKYAEIFPFRTEQAVPGNIREFEADIKIRLKVSEMGVPFWYDPRQLCFFYNT